MIKLLNFIIISFPIEVNDCILDLGITCEFARIIMTGFNSMPIELYPFFNPIIDVVPIPFLGSKRVDPLDKFIELRIEFTNLGLLSA